MTLRRSGSRAGHCPAGAYLRTRLRGEPPELYSRIGPTFEAIAAQNPSDDTRPSIEFYRRLDEIDLLLPVASE